MKNKRLADTFGADFRAWARMSGYILICPIIEKYSREIVYIAVAEEDDNFYTYGRIYSCGRGDWFYYQQGMRTFKNHKDATRAACEFFGIN